MLRLRLCSATNKKLWRIRARSLMFLNMLVISTSLGEQDQTLLLCLGNGVEHQCIIIDTCMFFTFGSISGQCNDEYLMDYSNTLMKLCLVFLFLVLVVVESGVCQSSTNLQLKIMRRNGLLLGLSTACCASVHHLLVRIPTVYLIYQ